jgi:hypothetical protein
MVFLELATSLVLAFVQDAAAPVATCRSLGVDPARTWRIERAGERWQVSHWRADRSTDVALVSLPASADVRLTSTAVDVRAKTSNGGIDVTLKGTPASATLDIYVSYELEVNVDASLTPKIDDLNTDGPLAVRCDLP